MKSFRVVSRILSALLLVILLLSDLPLPHQVDARIASSSSMRISLTFGHEQAHYLLAQMRRRNLDLRANTLEDLDPNEIAGLRNHLVTRNE
jgi:hypothetical protein